MMPSSELQQAGQDTCQIVPWAVLPHLRRRRLRPNAGATAAARADQAAHLAVGPTEIIFQAAVGPQSLCRVLVFARCRGLPPTVVPAGATL
jgi:hypothetical protein